MRMDGRDRPDRNTRTPYAQRSLRRTSRAVALSTPLPAISSKALDFASIALCSCVLAILCHSAANPPASNASAGTTNPTPAPMRSASNAVQPFTLTTQRPTLKDEESQER